MHSLGASIARARYELVQELVDVFPVVEVGGRPPVGGKAGTKGEWTIGGLILPVPGDMRRKSSSSLLLLHRRPYFSLKYHRADLISPGYPPDHINAVITHTLHFLSLLTFYLGIKLPFEIMWISEKLGVGQPFIGAGKGGEAGGWAKWVFFLLNWTLAHSICFRWHKKQPLHVSASATPVSAPTSPGEPIPISSESFIGIEPSAQTEASFTTGLAMLLYNVCYLAYTQNVDIQLSQAGDILSNLWSVCCSSELGRFVIALSILSEV